MSFVRHVLGPASCRLVTAHARQLCFRNILPRACVAPMRPIQAHSNFSMSSRLNNHYRATPLSIDTYHRVSDATLNHIDEYLEDLGDQIEMDGFDVEYSQGVMTIKVGAHGTYVINKQPPNQQIWVSSPTSGPKRYDYDAEQKKWFYHRDEQTLDELLNNELSHIFGQPIDILEGFSP